jgi:hypothetical protein
MGCESCATRGLVQTVSGYVDPIRGMLLGVWVVVSILYTITLVTMTDRPKSSLHQLTESAVRFLEGGNCGRAPRVSIRPRVAHARIYT